MERNRRAMSKRVWKNTYIVSVPPYVLEKSDVRDKNDGACPPPGNPRSRVILYIPLKDATTVSCNGRGWKVGKSIIRFTTGASSFVGFYPIEYYDILIYRYYILFFVTMSGSHRLVRVYWYRYDPLFLLLYYII